MKRKRFSDTELEALWKGWTGKRRSPAERVALHRLGSWLPSPEDVVRFAVRETFAIERIDERGTKVHEAAIKAHLKAMGPWRAEALVGELGKINWSSLKPRVTRLDRGGLEDLRRLVGRVSSAARRIQYGCMEEPERTFEARVAARHARRTGHTVQPVIGKRA